MSISTSTPSTRFWIAGAVVAVAAVIGAILIPASAQAAPVALSGVVDGPTGSALASVTVTALLMDDLGNATSAASTVTTSHGAFAFSALAESSTYTLSFAATSTTYAQYLGNTSDLAQAQKIILDSGGGNEYYVTAALSGGGALSGKVTTSSNSAIKGYAVRAYTQDPSGGWSVTRSATTSSSGAYSMTGLEPGDYRVEALDAAAATGAYAPAFSGGATDVEDATSVGVVAGKTATSSFKLGKSGSVAGTVTGHVNTTTEKVAGVRVTVYRITGTIPSLTATALDAPSTTTSSAGAYKISGLAPGSYTLEFSPRTIAPLSASGQQYGRSFLGGADTALGATSFQIVNGTALTGRNIQLAAGASIDGQVLEAENLAVGIPHIRVTVDYLGSNPDNPSEHAQTTLTDASGDYTFTGLGPGSYQLYIGSNVDQDRSDGIAEVIDRVREIVPVAGGALAVGEVRNQGNNVPLKVPGGIYPTVNPSITDIDSAGFVIGQSELAIQPGSWDEPIDFAQDVRYQWLRDGAPITGATSVTYDPTAGDLSSEISARIIIDSFAYGRVTYLVPEVGPIQAGTLSTSDPYLTGDDRVGHVLTATSTGWSQPGVVLSYAWELSSNSVTWNPIAGSAGHGTSHTVTQQDLISGPYIRAEVRGDREGFNSLTIPSDTLTMQDGQIVSDAPPVVSKTASVFVITDGGWTPATVDTTTVTWTVYQTNGSSSSYVQPTLPLAGTAGLRVTAYIEHQAVGYLPGFSDTVTAQLGDAPVPTGGTAMVGTPQYGGSVSAPAVTWAPAGDAPSYQWQYKSGSTWKNLVGATGSSYGPLVGDIGRLLRVVATETKLGYQTATLVSTASVPVATGAAPVNTVAASSSGSVVTSQVVTANPGTWSLPAKFAYQWKYSSNGSAPFTKVSGGTHAQFTIPGSLYFKHLFVDVTATPTAAKHPAATVTVAVGVVGHGVLTAVKPLKLSHVGTLYTAAGATWSPTPDNIAYSWYVGDGSDTPVFAANGPTFAIPSGDAHAHITVHGQADLTGYSSTFTPNVLVQKGTIVPAAGITLSGGPVGAPLTPANISWGVTGITLKYSWQFLSGSTWKSISGATHSTYTPSASYLGKELRVRVTASHSNYTSATVSSSPTIVTPGAAPAPSSLLFPPGINGYQAIGNTMTAVPGTWSLSGVKFSYQWELSPDNIIWTHVPGATASTFVIPNSAYNTDYVGLVITATKTGYTPGTVGLATAGKAVSGQLTTVTQPRITKSGSKLTISKGVWNVSAPGLSYEWDVYDPTTGNSTIVSSTNTYTLHAADAGKYITGTVAASFTNYQSNSRTLTAQTGAKIAPVTPLTLTGTNAVDSVLTANWVDWTPASPFVAVRWYRNGVLIPGEYNATYPQVPADLGKTISAKITVSQDGYAGATYTLTSAVTQSDVVLSPSVDPSITGTDVVGSTLTAHPGTWNVAGVTFSYRWYRNNGIAIPGATASTYLLTPLDAHQDLNVIVTASRAFYQPATATSPSVTVDPAVALAMTGSIVIPSTGSLGQKITPTLGKWNLPATITYQWQYAAAPYSNWYYVSGATAPAYTPALADGVSSGTEIRLLVFANSPGQPAANTVSNVMAVN